MIVLHAGLRKAGSSTLQSFMSQNEDAFRTLGVEYPALARVGTPGATSHLNLARELLSSDRFVPAVGTLAEIAEFWRESSASVLAISSEVLELCEFDQAARLQAALWGRGECFRIVLILRDLAALAPSVWTQQVKAGVITTEFDTFWSEFIQRPRVNYFATARNWARAFGWRNLEVRLLEPAALVNGDLIDDFVNVMGFSPGDAAISAMPRPSPQNVAPGWRVLEALRAYFGGRLEMETAWGDPSALDWRARSGIGAAAAEVGGAWGWNVEKGLFVTREQAEQCHALYVRAVARIGAKLERPLPAPASLESSGFRPRGRLPSLEDIPRSELRDYFAAVAQRVARAVEGPLAA